MAKHGYLGYFGAKRVDLPVKRADRWRLRISATWLRGQNAVLSLARMLLFRGSRTQPGNILVFRTGSLGDSICAIPAIAAIRKHFPTARITLLVNVGKKGLVSPKSVIGKDLYDDLIDYSDVSPSALLNVLRRKRFDLVIQLPQVDATFLRLLRDTVYFRLVASAGWGWKVSRVVIFRKLLERSLFYYNEAERLLNLVREHDIETTDPRFHLNIGVTDEERVEKFTRENGLVKAETITVAVGANSVKNRWPIGYFAEVIGHFQKTHKIVLIGGPDDNDLVRSFANQKNVYNCCGSFTPMQSALLIRNSLISLCNDTGPLHLSYAVGTPVIGLFAARDFYGKWFPPESSANRVFRTRDVPCSLCFFGACADNVCMQAITPDRVIEAMEELIGNTPTTGAKALKCD
jgi:lipopolysaccharide heptosyltransferase II